MSQAYPHIVSSVNGLKIPLLPGQAGILHRFENPENRLVIASTSYNPIHDVRDDAETLVVPSASAPEGKARAPAAAPRASDEVAELRAQLAEATAALAAAAKPAKVSKAKAAPAVAASSVL